MLHSPTTPHYPQTAHVFVCFCQRARGQSSENNGDLCNIAVLIACFSNICIVMYIMKPMMWRYCAVEIGRISSAGWNELPHTSPHTLTDIKEWPMSRVQWDFPPKPLACLHQPSPHTDTPPRTASSFPITPHDPHPNIPDRAVPRIRHSWPFVCVNIFLQWIFPSIHELRFLAGVTVTMENQAATGHKVKRRAARACSSCRSRKVRCNVVESGPPCTNCRLDSVKCVTVRNRRHRSVYPRFY